MTPEQIERVMELVKGYGAARGERRIREQQKRFISAKCWADVEKVALSDIEAALKGESTDGAV